MDAGEIKRICISDTETNTKHVRQIRMFVADMWLYCDLVNERQIVLAKRLAEANGIDLEIHPTRLDNVIA